MKRLFNKDGRYDKKSIKISEELKEFFNHIFEKHKDINPRDLFTLIHLEANEAMLNSIIDQ